MALALSDKSKTLTSRWRGMCRLTVIPTTELDFLRVVEGGGGGSLCPEILHFYLVVFS